MGKLETKLYQLIDEIRDAHLKRKSSADSMNRLADEQISALRNQLDSCRESQVEAEISGDQETAEKYRSRISNLKREIDELNEKKVAYQTAATKGNYTDKLKQVRDLCEPVMLERVEKTREIDAVINQKESLIKKTQAEIEALQAQKQAVHSQKLEDKILPIVELIDPRVKSLKPWDLNKFIDRWLGRAAGDPEELFNPEIVRDPGTYPIQKDPEG